MYSYSSSNYMKKKIYTYRTSNSLLLIRVVAYMSLIYFLVLNAMLFVHKPTLKSALSIRQNPANFFF